VPGGCQRSGHGEARDADHQEPELEDDEGKVDDFAAFFGASNVLCVLVERRIRKQRRRTRRA
jgi:hypothetical protein